MLMTSQSLSTRPGLPSPRVKAGITPSGTRAPSRPTWPSIASAVASSMSWFFGEKASIEGRITIERTVPSNPGRKRAG